MTALLLLATGWPRHEPRRDDALAAGTRRLTLHLAASAVEDLGSFAPSGADLGSRATVRFPPDTVAGSASVSDDRTPPAVYRFTVVRS